MRAALIYPHQLFASHPAIPGTDLSVLVEEPLFFTQYRFHAQKLILHRASMQQYAEGLRKQGEQVHYVESYELATTGEIAKLLNKLGVTEVQFVDPCDDWLQSRLTTALDGARIKYQVLTDPHFLTPATVFADYARSRKKLFFADFYSFQRKRLELLLDDKGKPVGGKWSFDADNRKKLPRGFEPPLITWPQPTRAVREAREYVATNFPQALGEPESFCYPTSHGRPRRVSTIFSTTGSLTLANTKTRSARARRTCFTPF